MSGKLRQIRSKFADVITKEELIRIVSDEARGFGWRARDESWATAVERHINPIHKSRFAKVVQLCKKLSCHVVGVPYEFTGAENLEVENLSRPTLVPVLMHSCGMMGKSVLGTIQKTEIGNMVGEVDDEEEVLDAKGSAQELVHRYKAIINTDITVKDAEKEGSHIGLAHNVTKIRRLVNRREELFANLISRRGMMPLLTLEIAFGIIYCHLSPTQRLRCCLFVVTCLTFLITNVLDASVRAKEKKLRKLKMRALHPHLFVKHIPLFYLKHNLPLPEVSKEDGESGHTFVKRAAVERSDHNLNVIDTTRTAELVRDIVIRDYATSSKQSLVSKTRTNSTFRRTVLPHLAVFGCVTSLTRDFASNFRKMLSLVSGNGVAEGFAFVYESDEAAHEARHPRRQEKPAGCPCICRCTCKDCKTKCECKCEQECVCRLVIECVCFQYPVILFLTGDGYPEEGDPYLHLDDDSVLENVVLICWCEQFDVPREKTGAAGLDSCSVSSFRKRDFVPLSLHLQRSKELQAAQVIKRYLMRQRLRQLASAARTTKAAFSSGKLFQVASLCTHTSPCSFVLIRSKT